MDGINDWFERVSLLSKLVFDPHRNLRIDGTLHNALYLQLA
jgi:hypothetical protein